MDVRIRGGKILQGEITPSGSKNSAMAILPASILIEGKVELDNVPAITDVEKIVGVLQRLGAKIEWDKEHRRMVIDNSDLTYTVFRHEDIGNMKGIAMFWGAMLTRFGKVVFEELPGGCTLGARPLDAHFLVFKDLGVKIAIDDNGVSMSADDVVAREVWLEEMSPTATANALMLAASIDGQTTIVGAAAEPSVQDLCNFLVGAGLKIEGIGSSKLVVVGGSRLSETKHRIFSDHIEIATYIALGACQSASLKILDAMPHNFVHIGRQFEKFGVTLEYVGQTCELKMNNGPILREGLRKTTVIRAQPWPGLPVDTLPLFIPLALACKEGTVMFHNWMYESALFWTGELASFGGNVVLCDPHRVIVTGGNHLHGAEVTAPYIIRAAVSLMMTALLAEGESVIRNIDPVFRGHPTMLETLTNLGADISLIR